MLVPASSLISRFASFTALAATSNCSRFTSFSSRFICHRQPHKEEKLLYAFCISDHELLVPIGNYLEKYKVSVEKVLLIVYQPQAVFRIRLVNYCSATIAGHTEALLSVAFSPNGRPLASGSGDTTVRLWDLNTQTPIFTCTGHKNWVLRIAWSPDGKHLVSRSKAGELPCLDPQKGKSSGHKKWITGVFWEPVHLIAPCCYFVSASKDGDARIWDVSLRKCNICRSGHMLAVTCVKWGGFGVIYTGSQDCTKSLGNYAREADSFAVVSRTRLLLEDGELLYMSWSAAGYVAGIGIRVLYCCWKMVLMLEVLPEILSLEYLH